MAAGWQGAGVADFGAAACRALAELCVTGCWAVSGILEDFGSGSIRRGRAER